MDIQMSEMNLETARYNMIEQQIRPWNVDDQHVLDLFTQVPREDFVPVAYRNQAFSDLCVPLENGQVMMPPKLEARMLQALAIQANETVLEVGTGSGYVTALLANLAKQVISVDIDAALQQSAGEKLTAHGINNVTLEVGDAACGWDKQGPYDVIVITGSVPLLNGNFTDSLNVGGRLFAIVGDAPAMEALLITHISEKDWSRKSLFETELPPLLNAPEPERFVL